ncbi:methylmalonyl-CoA mutase family protein [Mangrovivirga cuniculi]|uniref:methylmalonyl-CoA mutase family protein n=1 Tax=Mangrovivirga cuniculi TaxID=2715131 RepID=UPI001585D7A2|nr:methylmalonyl-CoA mutase family protein [Mangrovivirga cuniculi]
MDKIKLENQSFDPIDKPQWYDKIIEDLKGKTSIEKLKAKTYEPFDVDPFYTEQESGQWKYLEILNRPTDKNKPREWCYLERIKVTNDFNANKEIKKALKTDVGGFILDLYDDPDIQFSKILDSIEQTEFKIFLESDNRAFTCLNRFTDYSKTEIIQNLSGGILYDPLSLLSRHGSIDDAVFSKIISMLERTENIKDFTVFSVDSSTFSNAGASVTQELAFSCSEFAEYCTRLSDMGVPLQTTISEKLTIEMGTGQNFFLEIAKGRALRYLFYKIAQEFGVKDISPHDFNILSRTSMWNKSLFDPYVNILRTTTETMSALLGGADYIKIADFNAPFRPSDDFSRRISRNISHLLRHESHFDKVADPVAGNWLIDSLTDKLIGAAWKLFLKTEEHGGYMEALKKGFVQQEINEVRLRKISDLAAHKEDYIGTTKFQMSAEIIDPDAINHDFNGNPEIDKALTPISSMTEFNQLRLRTEAFVKRLGQDYRPMVIPVLLNNTAVARARKEYAGLFFGSAGFRIEDSMVNKSLDEQLEYAHKFPKAIIAFCADNDALVDEEIKLFDDYKLNEKSEEQILSVLGKPTDYDKLKSCDAIDFFINQKTNTIDLLTHMQKKLGVISTEKETEA